MADDGTVFGIVGVAVAAVVAIFAFGSQGSGGGGGAPVDDSQNEAIRQNREALNSAVSLLQQISGMSPPSGPDQTDDDPTDGQHLVGGGGEVV